MLNVCPINDREWEVATVVNGERSVVGSIRTDPNLDGYLLIDNAGPREGLGANFEIVATHRAARRLAANWWG